jgi:hypothetical protein
MLRRLRPGHFLVAVLTFSPFAVFAGCGTDTPSGSVGTSSAPGDPDAGHQICGPGTYEDGGVCLPEKPPAGSAGVAGASGTGGASGAGGKSGAAGAAGKAAKAGAAGASEGGSAGEAGEAGAAGGVPTGECGPGTKLVDGVCIVDVQGAGGVGGNAGCVGGAAGEGGTGVFMGFGGAAGATNVFGAGGAGSGSSAEGVGGSSGTPTENPCEDPCDSATTDCDGDGWTVAQGDCCDKVGPCGQTPALQNPGAVEYKGDGVDNDCDGFFDETEKPCDYELTSAPNDAFEYLRALDLCQFTQENVPIEQRKWGVISAAFTTADGLDYPDPRQRAIRAPKFGDGLYPLRGGAMLVLSSGVAADVHSDSSSPPGWELGKDFSNISNSMGTSSMFPADWLKANNYQLPTGCTGSGTEGDANDSVMLTIRLRVPTNAQSFSLQSLFMSAEFPEFICSTFNDLFLVLVKNESGKPASPNPADGNIAFFQTGSGTNIKKFPVGINLGGDPVAQKLFSVCDPQHIGCSSSPVTLECAQGIDLLKGTGYEKTESFGDCTIGGGTDWLTVAGNVVPGGIVEVRILIADVGDSAYDSTVLLDSFVWNATPGTPGTN